MAANYVLLASQTVGAVSASSVTFSNIPQTGYTDLKIVGSTRCDGASAQLIAKFNGSTTGYSRKLVYGDGSTPNSSGGSAEAHVRFSFSETSSQTASTFNSFDLYIPNYTSANQKSLSSDSVSENNAAGAEAGLHTGLWSGTDAITSINISDVSATNFVQYSSFYLYGLAASGVTPVIAPFATGGNVTNDGTYWIHTFLASGTFTPLKTLSCDYLVVAGGGGGGVNNSNNNGDGGGAGGLRSTVTATGGGGTLETALSVTAQAYSVTVGATSALATTGNDSTFATITSNGGGRGAGNGTGATSGGSGGGARGGSNGSPGAGTANQGYAGAGTSAGGGGAGVAGSTNGTGGAGVAVAITGTSVTYAGGGGGSGPFAGGAGGGGAGTTNGNGVNGTNGLGGGGGGASSSYTPGTSGGSGIVIVRYAMV